MNATLNGTQNNMNAWICKNRIRQLAHLKTKGRILKGLLHGSFAKGSQISATFSRRAVRIFRGQFGERSLSLRDLLAVGYDTPKCWLVNEATPSKREFTFYQLQSLLFGASDDVLSPWGWTSRVLVLDQQMGTSDLVRTWRWSALSRLIWSVPLRLFCVDVQVIMLA